jgi:carboxypeptidase family protein/VCBS repeat protein
LIQGHEEKLRAMSAGRRALRTLAGAGLLAMVSGVLASVPALAATGTITGVITNSATSAPIAGVQVATSPASLTTTTDSAGAYSLTVTSGTAYDVLFTMSGYNNNFVGAVTAPSGGSVAANQALLAVPALAAQDLFSRPNQSGIGTASDGNTWTRDSGVYPAGIVDIVNRSAFIQTAAQVTDLDTWMGIAYRDQEVTADINAVALIPPDGFPHGGRLLARVTGVDQWIVLTLNPSDNTLAIWADFNTNWAQLNVVAHAFSLNTTYHAKLDVIGTVAYGKAWASGTAEPGWQVIGVGIPGALMSAGQSGLRTGGADAYFSNFMEIPITQISGNVTDAGTARAIAGATVSLNSGPSTVTDANGNYVLSNVSPGTYTVTASAPAHNSGSTTASVSVGVSAFATNFALTGGPAPVTIALKGKPLVGDFSGDGKADLAMVDTSSISVGVSTGSALTGPTSGKWANFPFYGTRATLAGDVTGDGKADVVAVNAGQTFVLPSTGTGFGAVAGWSNVAFYGTRGTFLADVSGDGKADLVAINDSSVWVMTSTGTGFAAPAPWSSSLFYGSVITTVGDVTGDGKADMIAVNAGNTFVMASSGIDFSGPTPWSNTPFYGNKTTMITDVSGDGKADLVAVNAGSTWLMTSTGTGFNGPTQWSGTPFYGQVATLSGDANGDAKADLIAVNSSSVWVATSNGTTLSAPVMWL